MSQEREAQTAADAVADGAASPGRGTRIGAVVIAALIILSLVLYFVGDRITPYTSQARVQAFVIPVAAEVSGKVQAVHIRNDDVVEPGQPLFDVDPDQYAIALRARPVRLRVGAEFRQCRGGRCRGGTRVTADGADEFPDGG